MALSQSEKNMVAVCQEVNRWCDRHNIHGDNRHPIRHRLQRIVIMTVLTESGGRMYASSAVPRSTSLPHDDIGSDHLSVGLFQQQVGRDGSNAFGWGTVEQCMDIRHSTDAFLNALDRKGLARWDGPELWLRCQTVQVSAFADGRNYRANFERAEQFINTHAKAIAGKAL